MTVTAITSYNQFKQVTSDEKRPVVIDFYATWCGPCRLISPKFLEWSNKETAVDFYQVDIDEQPAIAREVSIRVVPTFVAFKAGNRLGHHNGARLDGLVTLIKNTASKSEAGRPAGESKSEAKEKNSEKRGKGKGEEAVKTRA